MDDIDLERIYETLYSRHRMWELHQKDIKPNTSLLSFLIRALPHIKRESWPERFEWGGIFINGRPAVCDVTLEAPCKIEYFEPKLPFPEMAKLYPPFLPDKYILYEDNDILIAFKPAGLPSKPAKEQCKFSLLRSLEEYTGRKLHMPSRLDVATSGVIIVSKSRRAHVALQQMFERHSIHKTYLLEVSASPGEVCFTVDKPIGRDTRHPILRRITPSGKPAVTKFTKLYPTGHGTTVLKAEPLTGRTHQIRVHAASEGLPLVGDTFYNGADAPDLHLISYRLDFIHPFSKENHIVTVPDELLPDWLSPEKLKPFF